MQNEKLKALQKLVEWYTNARVETELAYAQGARSARIAHLEARAATAWAALTAALAGHNPSASPATDPTPPTSPVSLPLDGPRRA